MDFTITNAGDSLIPGDTIYVGLNIGTTFYTLNGGFLSGQVNYLVVGVDGFPNGATSAVNVDDVSGSWMSTAFGASNGTLCATILGVGDSVLSGSNSDANLLDNFECVNWSDASDFGEYDLSQIDVYPNPASTDVYFSIGTVQADQIQILDLSGRIIDVINVTNSIEMLDVNSYQNGIYFYSVVKGETVLTTEKFVVSR